MFWTDNVVSKLEIEINKLIIAESDVLTVGEKPFLIMVI